MRIDVPEQKKLVFEMRLPIRWGDMDAMGHVNNIVYFRYFEVLRIEWLAGLGGQPDPTGTGPVIANTFCNFLVQLEYPGELIGKVYLANAGRSSFDTFMTLERTDRPGVIAANGGATIVWVDFPKHASAPLPDWLRALVG